MSDLQTSKDIRSTISSPASAAGAEPYDKRIGPIIGQFGLEAVLASLSASRAKEVGKLRGFGNAIDPRPAQVFIESVKEILDFRTRP